MTTDTSATVREEAPHVNQRTRTATIMNALKRRAQAVLSNKSIDPQSRAIIRYALEINDPSLAELVRRADAGEIIFDTVDFSQTPDTSHHDSSDEKIEALTQMLCRGGDEPETKSAALLVLMATIENSTHPKALANTAKHLAFAHCGELNLRAWSGRRLQQLSTSYLRTSFSARVVRLSGRPSVAAPRFWNSWADPYFLTCHRSQRSWPV